MILIGESGATKTDWRIVSNSGDIHQVRTIGLNPYQQKFEQIRDEIHNELLPRIDGKVIEIHFYGAGCSMEEPKDVISQALRFSFPEADVEVESDLLAAARSLCGHEEDIACILGTGSNSCYYDGEKILKSVPPLGFIIADEGSGSYLGKQLVADYFREDMPEELRDKFFEKYQVDRSMVLDKVYKKEKAGRYLADFSRFIAENIKTGYMQDLVYTGFGLFLEKNIFKYENYKDLAVHFTGGIAFHFNDILINAAKEKEIAVGKVVENPIAGLTIFHAQA